MPYGHSGDLAVIMTAYSLGKAAYQDGLTLASNPYKPNTWAGIGEVRVDLSSKWAEGWDYECARDRNGKAPTPMPRSNADNPRPSA